MNQFKKKEDYGDQFNQHLLEQYKLYVEMADRISARRMLANSFFVSINTALMGAFALFLRGNTEPLKLIWFAPLIALIILCFVWWRIINSYRQLNSGKFKVIHSMEQILPAAPYDAEWTALGCGKDTKLYRPLTNVENLVPICFTVLYFIMGIHLALTRLIACIQ